MDLASTNGGLTSIHQCRLVLDECIDLLCQARDLSTEFMLGLNGGGRVRRDEDAANAWKNECVVFLRYKPKVGYRYNVGLSVSMHPDSTRASSHTYGKWGSACGARRVHRIRTGLDVGSEACFAAKMS